MTENFSSQSEVGREIILDWLDIYVLSENGYVDRLDGGVRLIEASEPSAEVFRGDDGYSADGYVLLPQNMDLSLPQSVASRELARIPRDNVTTSVALQDDLQLLVDRWFCGRSELIVLVTNESPVSSEGSAG